MIFQLKIEVFPLDIGKYHSYGTVHLKIVVPVVSPFNWEEGIISLR